MRYSLRVTTPQTPTRFGYARVSTDDQHLDGQLGALTAAGCVRTWSEHASGADRTRGELAACLDHLRAGDALVITKLDRLARSVSHLCELSAYLSERGVDLIVLDQGIDTSTPAGKLMFHVIAAVAEFERDLIRERTVVGIAAARLRGAVPGRPVRCTPDKLAAAETLMASGQTLRSAAASLGLSASTLCGARKRAERAALAKADVA